MNRTGTPPRVKPCPSCGASCHIAATRCACGQAMPRATKPRRRVTADDRLEAALLADAAAKGRYHGPVPIVGKRRSSKPGTVMRIRALAAEGKTLPEIAHIMQCSRTNIRRFRDDYGIKITNGESGPSFDGVTSERINATLQAVKALIEAGEGTAAIAKQLSLHPATVRVYSKRCRDLFGIALPEFDRRSRCGKAAK